MPLNQMTADELFAQTGGAYLSLIHLEDGVDEAVARISSCCGTSSSQLIDQLLRDGDSWRERLTGLVMASTRGIKQHYDSLICGFQQTGCISIVPMSALISVAVRDRECKYDPSMTNSLDRDAWDGEIGFALDWLHHTIGRGDAPDRRTGPNYGQDFNKQLDFYTTLNGA
jgi:hypothetical protein